MGLNVSYVAIMDDSTIPPKIALCRPYKLQPVPSSYTEQDGTVVNYISNAWHQLPHNYRDREQDAQSQICKGCPLQCQNEERDPTEFYGCYPRLGSYGFVDRLPKFVERWVPTLANNAYIRLINSGGGAFEEIPMAELQGVLEGARELERVLSEFPYPAAVTYLGGKRVEPSPNYHGSRPEWPGDWPDPGWSIRQREDDKVRVGVHETRGVWAARGAVVLYESTEPTTDPEVLRRFGAAREDGGVYFDELRFEPVPALLEFGQIVTRFIRIAELGLKYNLQVTGC